MEWAEFIMAFVVFFVSHALPVRPENKAIIVGQLGIRGYTLAYSALSIAVLYWLILATGRAPYFELWEWRPWQNHVPQIALLFAFSIVGLALGRPNPFSFGGSRNSEFTTSSPGLVRWMRHPLLVSMLIWATAHIVPNGDLAHFILFSTFAAFSWLGMRMINNRKRREMGDQAWVEQFANSRYEGTAVLGMPIRESLLRLIAGGAIYGAVLAGHSVLFGGYPLG